MVAAGQQQSRSTFAEGGAGNNFGRGGPGKRRSRSLQASSEHIARYIPECCGDELFKSSEYEQNIQRKMVLVSVGTVLGNPNLLADSYIDTLARGSCNQFSIFSFYRTVLYKCLTHSTRCVLVRCMEPRGTVVVVCFTTTNLRIGSPASVTLGPSLVQHPAVLWGRRNKARISFTWRTHPLPRGVECVRQFACCQLREEYAATHRSHIFSLVETTGETSGTADNCI